MRKNIWLLCLLFCYMFSFSVYAETVPDESSSIDKEFVSAESNQIEEPQCIEEEPASEEIISEKLDFLEENSTETKENIVLTEDEENENDENANEDNEENIEDSPVIQDGIINFTQKQSSFTNDYKQQYSFSYQNDTHHYTQGIVTFRFEKGFTPTSLKLGNWIVNTDEEIIHVVLHGYNDMVTEYDIAPGESITSLESIGEVEFLEMSCSAEGSYEIENIIISGLLDNVDTINVTANFDGYYNEELLYHTDKNLEAKHIYYVLSTPAIKIDADSVFFGKEFEVKIKDLSGYGTASMQNCKLTIKLPKNITLTGFSLPEMENATVKVLYNDNEFVPENVTEGGIVTIIIEPNAKSFSQNTDLIFTVKNCTKIDASILLSAKITAAFSDYDNIKKSMFSNTVFLENKEEIVDVEEKEEPEKPEENSDIPSEPTPEKIIKPEEIPSLILDPIPTQTEKETKKKNTEKKVNQKKDEKENIFTHLLDNTKKLINSVGNKLTTGTIEEVQAKTKEDKTDEDNEIAEEIKDTSKEAIKKKTNTTVKENRGVQFVLIFVLILLMGILAVLFLLIRNIEKTEEN